MGINYTILFNMIKGTKGREVASRSYTGLYIFVHSVVRLLKLK